MRRSLCQVLKLQFSQKYIGNIWENSGGFELPKINKGNGDTRDYERVPISDILLVNGKCCGCTKKYRNRSPLVSPFPKNRKQGACHRFNFQVWRTENSFSTHFAAEVSCCCQAARIFIKDRSGIPEYLPNSAWEFMLSNMSIEHAKKTTHFRWNVIEICLGRRVCAILFAGYVVVSHTAAADWHDGGSCSCRNRLCRCHSNLSSWICSQWTQEYKHFMSLWAWFFSRYRYMYPWSVWFPGCFAVMIFVRFPYVVFSWIGPDTSCYQ